MFTPKKIKTEQTDFTFPPPSLLNSDIKIKKEEIYDHENLEEEDQEQNQEQTEPTAENPKPTPSQTNPSQNEPKQKQTKTGKSKPGSSKPGIRKPVISRRVPKGSNMQPIGAQNRQRLSLLLHDLAVKHEWKDASGVFSVLLKGTPKGTTLREDRANFLVAAEILKKFGDKDRFEAHIKKLFEIWMGKLNWLKRSNDKKTMVMIELALFYISQGNIQEAYNITNILIQDKRIIKTTPTLKLLHGLVSYQIWYTNNIPEAMQIKDFDFYLQSEIKNLNFEASENNTLESSNDQNAPDIEDAGFESESSVCNNNNGNLRGKNENPRKKTVVNKRNKGFYVNESYNNSERDDNNINNNICSNTSIANLGNTSIYLAHGLDVNLLPIKLKLMHEDLRTSIESYGQLKNEMYNCAVQNLRDALYSNPPFISALLPLIQILLLGDRVKDADAELEKCCTLFNTTLPFRLRAKLMESFAKGQTKIISSCCEEVLKRDQTCFYSITCLIRLHKNGDYSTNNLLEMIATHIDTVDGKQLIWEGLASCFINLVNYEDNVSINTNRGLNSILNSKFSSKKLPEVFLDNRVRGTWRIRHRWWMNMHFSEKNIVFDTQLGDHKLLTCKAACASHIYGPEFNYVKKVCEMLEKQGLNDDISFLRVHLKNPLCEIINILS